ncbi:MAG: hypothetical protein DI536_16005 [Archangium gephyra]|uniref:Uncharacterized protein n=1 Tax=Archangium gephyra TaxID=48 RepID=A0A2W5T8K5_9BACT|nr:MAG: hypothetical protein DI536_16005 [Archangium gephyra]
MQALPPDPQLTAEFGLQTLPSQHPSAHESAVHTQLPTTHARPGAQAALAPQRQAPDTQRSVCIPRQL